MSGTVGRKSAARREQILDAATGLFADRGYHDVDTQSLAEALGVGKGTLYRQFASKRELFLAAVDRVTDRLRTHVEAAVAGRPDPLEQINAAIGSFLDFFAEHPAYVELLIQERALFRDRPRPSFYDHRERTSARWQVVYRGLMDAGRFRELPTQRISDVFSHIVYGTMFTNHFNGRSTTSASQAAEILDVVYRGLLSDAERAAGAVSA